MGLASVPSTRAVLRRPGVLTFILHKEGCFRLAIGILVPGICAGLDQPRQSRFRTDTGDKYTGESVSLPLSRVM